MADSANPLRVADVRERNEKIVLRLIYGSGEKGLSQSEAVLATGLRAPTIFRIFSSLESTGYIKPFQSAPGYEPGAERKGRPRVPYLVVHDVLYTIGVEFWIDRISIGVFDFSGRRVSSRLVLAARGVDATAVAEGIAILVDEAIAGLGIDRARILGVGVGAPGQVNVRRREIAFYSRIAGMRDYPLAAVLEARLGLPVSLHNNCSVVALAESRYGSLPASDSMFMFLLRSGVNGAFIDSGRIYLTSDGTTIETGHVSVSHEGPPCVCGANGCLEAFLTGLDRANLETGGWLFEDLASAVVAGDAAAESVLAEAARYLASAARSINRLFKPRDFLVVAGSQAIAAALCRLVRARLDEAHSGFDRVDAEFTPAVYDPVLAQRGAADLVIDEFLGS